MGSVSCEGEDGCDESESMRDRFSELELKVVHHILSFLTITELTISGCVSRRCREIYLSTPSLNFVHFSDSNTNSCFSRLRLISSLDRYFLNRVFNQIVSFRFCWEKHYPDEDSDEGSCFCVNEHFRLMTWINNVVRCNVEVMHLEVCSYDENDLKIELVLPHCVFACGSLRSLVVQMSCTVIKSPTTLSSNIRFLELRDVEVEEGFFKWISSSCKYIEELVVQDVQSIENITIQSLSLTSSALVQHYGHLG
ncbi:hypothetical protein ACLB2K_001327 [Fragaria x ananassa]